MYFTDKVYIVIRNLHLQISTTYIACNTVIAYKCPIRQGCENGYLCAVWYSADNGALHRGGISYVEISATGCNCCGVNRLRCIKGNTKVFGKGIH